MIVFCFALPPLVLEAYAEGSWPFLLSLTNLKLEDFPLATEKELAMARGEGRPPGNPGGIMASIAGLGGGATAAEVVKHRALEEAFVVQGEERRVLNLKGFVQEDFGVVFDEVCIECLSPVLRTCLCKSYFPFRLSDWLSDWLSD